MLPLKVILEVQFYRDLNFKHKRSNPRNLRLLLLVNNNSSRDEVPKSVVVMKISVIGSVSYVDSSTQRVYRVVKCAHLIQPKLKSI